jgi:hypothetical protein
MYATSPGSVQIKVIGVHHTVVTNGEKIRIEKQIAQFQWSVFKKRMGVTIACPGTVDLLHQCLPVCKIGAKIQYPFLFQKFI